MLATGGGSRTHEQERARLHVDADAAFTSGDKATGRALLDQASAAGDAMRGAEAAAAEAILKHRNQVCSPRGTFELTWKCTKEHRVIVPP